jgi:large subunit ribosomal protein L29
MKAAKMRELTPQELGQQCDDMRRELFNLRIRKSGGQIEQPSRIRSLRRDIARARTILTQQKNSVVGA